MGRPGILRLLAVWALMLGPGLGIKVEIRADSNRDGMVDIKGDTDLLHKQEWSDEAGAIFLANVGDTGRRCSLLALEKPPSQEALAACHDASDDVQRSPQHMAPLRVLPIPEMSDEGWVTVGVHTEVSRRNVRIFKQTPIGWSIITNDDRIPAREVRKGLSLGIDARDTRRPSGWDGRVEVRVDLFDGKEMATDAVRLRVAPVITFTHLMPVSQVLVTNGNETESPDHKRFVDDLRTVLRRSDLALPLFTFDHSDDVWAQDFVEPAYTSMPGPQGPVRLEIMIRSPQGGRVAGRQVFEYLRSATRGAVHTTGGLRDEIDSTGNTETIPPYSHRGRSFPVGRVIQGSHGEALPHLLEYFAAQEIQSPLVLDVDWLAVGHVDEIVQFLPSDDSPHGWALFVADPLAGLKILQDAIAAGHGGVQAFSRKGLEPKTLRELVTDELVEENERFAARIERVRQVLEEETGIPRRNQHRVPLVFETGFCLPTDEGVMPIRNCSADYAVAAYPGVINGVVLSDEVYLSPNPWGPVIDGKDILAEATSKVYGEVGLEVVYIDNWFSLHLGGGEVHCGTNTVRVPERNWWEAAPMGKGKSGKSGKSKGKDKGKGKKGQGKTGPDRSEL